MLYVLLAKGDTKTSQRLHGSLPLHFISVQFVILNLTCLFLAGSVQNLKQFIKNTH